MNKQQIIEKIKKTNIYQSLKKALYQTKCKDYNQLILDNENANDYIRDLLLREDPMMISRLGSNELKVLEHFVKKNSFPTHLKNAMINNAGFFPVNDASLTEFSELYFKCMNNIDLLGIWFNPFEDTIANNYCVNAKLTKLRNLEPYFSEKPWSYYLKGKKVLVIHPFVSSIESQYKKHTLLFQNPHILPAFELITYKAVQSIGGNTNFDSWFDALEYMQKDISEIDFDIAIIGAGAYGLPLASFVKNMGKKAIHLGGSTQMLFGVYGRRWEILPDFQDIINEHWIKPQIDEKPKSANSVENACYW